MFLNEDWVSFLENELSENYFVELKKFITQEYKDKVIYPEYENIFRAFNLLDPNKVKVVIIGQDPYHGLNQANGLAFSVSQKCKIPPSLLNIFKELQEDMACEKPASGDLSLWASQGVLLMNTLLSVAHGSPYSHQGKGWEIFTDAVISRLSEKFEHLVFILWGAPSQKKASLIDASKHLVLKAPHPSPLSAYRGFFGSKPFSQTNDYLKMNHIAEIDWSLPTEQTLL